MQRLSNILGIAMAGCLCSIGVALAPAGVPSAGRQDSSPKSEQRAAPEVQPPSEAELHTRTDQLIANQHDDDKANEQYEHIERQIDRTGGATPSILVEKTYRIVPTGSGTLKILLKNDGKTTDPEEYRKQLESWKEVLELTLRPDDPRAKNALAKFQKRNRDRAELVDAAKDAFREKWVGREYRNGYDCDVVQLEPNPQYHPHSMLQEAVTHVRAKVWVDHNLNQLVHAEAEVIRDISFGGGILGKVYKGGVFSFDQGPVAPGIWLALRYQYDFSGRKFLFPFEEHQVVESSHYRRVGPPKEALALVQNELASGKTMMSDP